MKRTDPELFAAFRLSCNLSVNENGIFFVSKQADLKKNTYRLKLCRLENGREKELAEVGAPGYWHCGEKLLYIEKEDEKKKAARIFPETTLRCLSYDGRTKRDVARLPHAVSEMAFLSENDFYFTAAESLHRDRALAENKGNRRKAEKQLAGEADYNVFTELPFWENGEGVIDGGRTRLYHYEGGTVTQVTGDETTVSRLTLDPEHTRLAFIASAYTDRQPLTDRLYCIDLATGEVRDITSADNLSHGQLGFLHDGRLAFTASVNGAYGLNQNADLYLYDFEAGAAQKLWSGGGMSLGNSVGSDLSAGRSLGHPIYEGGERLFTLATDNDHTDIVGISKQTGELSVLLGAAGMISEAVLWGDNFYYVAHRGLNGPEIFKCDLSGAETQLSYSNAAIGLDYEFSAPRRIEFTNEAGDAIYGYGIAPIGYKKGIRYKTVLSVHGGPKTAFGTNLFHEMQLLAANGYAVIYCNPTGSDGRGDRFADIRGRYGDIDYRDIMTFCDKAAEQFDFVDPDRMAVIGGSYGGFMTNWIIGHTDRFKAAVSQRSISNWITFTMTSDIGPYFGTDQTSGDIWQSQQKLWEQSPLKYADAVRTPTLFIHADCDYRCPLSEGVSMYTALKVHGVPARMCVFKGENHELSRSGKPLHRVRRLREILGWLDQYLG